MGAIRKDITGQRFGRLVVVAEAQSVSTSFGRKRYNWICKCDCGNSCIKSSSNLLSGDTLSCGCLRSESVSRRNIETSKHGESRTRLYKIWAGMKNRCYCQSHHEFDRYGSRGITVCDQWMNYDGFRSWALTSGYKNSADCTIDRIDNNKGYFPENCRWVTPKQQSNNRSTNVLITDGEETHTIAEWSSIVGLRPDTIRYRLCHGWSTHDALHTKPR